MKKYIIRKLLAAVPILIGITLIDFALMSLAGDPLDMLAGPRVTREALALRAGRFGLDQPFLVQYLTWLEQLLQGNLGYSFKNYQPVAELIFSHIGPTLLLTGTSLLLGLLIAVPVGVYSALHHRQKRGYAWVTASFAMSAIPGFFLALLLIDLFTVHLGWLPSSGMVSGATGGNALDVARHMVMPVIVLALPIAGRNIRYIRSAVLEIMQADHLRTARSKGLGRKLVIRRHMLRNALLPVITVIGMEIPALFGGAVIAEQIFSWPGLGMVTMNAIVARDHPVIMGVCLLAAVVVQAANLLTDILYALADPTIRY